MTTQSAITTPPAAQAPNVAGDTGLEHEQRIVNRIISYFETQEILASQPEISVDQSAVSLWLKRGRIPSGRMKGIIDASARLVSAGKRGRAIVPNDFFVLPRGEAECAWDGVLIGKIHE